MPKVKIIYYSEKIIDNPDSNYDITILTVRDMPGVTWEEVTDKDVEFLRYNINYLPCPEKMKASVAILDETPIHDSIKLIKDAIEKEKQRREKEVKKHQEQQRKQEIEKAEKAYARKKKQLEKLKKELQDK